MRKLLIALLAAWVLSANASLMLAACPFCSAVSQTLRQEMEAMEVVAIAKIVKGSETDSDAEFVIQTVLRGESLVKDQQTTRVNYFGKAAEGTQFLLMGVDPPDLLWSSPLPVSPIAVDYVKAITKLPEDRVQRAEFYLQYLEHSDPLLARDAYDEFASTEYSDLKKLAPKLDREKLLGWIKDTSLPPDRKRLHLVLLGICGKPEDTKLLSEMLRSDDPNKKAGLDAMISCYITLLGEDGVQLIDELFLANKQSQYADTFSAIQALRFHETDGGVIGRERVVKSLRLILDRPELADLVIPDLARCEDWSSIDRLVELFKTADEKSSWVRVPVINYLRACPKPEAAAKLKELEKLDPASYKRANAFFPVQPPKPAPNAGESSSKIHQPQPRWATSDVPESFPSQVELASGSMAAAMVDVGSRTTFPPNRAVVVSVLCVFSATVWLAMWLSISGGGRYGVFEYALVPKNSRN